MNFEPMLEPDEETKNDTTDIQKSDRRTCALCKKVYMTLYKTYINDEDTCKIYYLCVFCRILKNFKMQYISDVVVCKSKMSQSKIIKTTYDLFIKNKKIPYPHDVDEDAERVELFAYKFFKNKDKYKDYKIFYTNKINKNDIISCGFLGGRFNLEKLDLKYFE
uniref:Uncharacterized protein n=1 Tax=viral metagenome TaxID=1070528 RepID=A0A6C0EEG2_9ZZZZ